VDEFACDLDIDWSRYLPREVRIDRREHDKYVFISSFASRNKLTLEHFT
jgi:hypothetical protein